MLNPSLLTARHHLKTVTARFPLAVLCCVLSCILLLIMMELGIKAGTWIIIFLQTLGYGFLVSIPVQLFLESKGYNKKYYLFITIPIVPVLVILNMMFLWQCLYIIPALTIFIPIAPFLTFNQDNEELWAFNYHIWMQILYVILATLALTIGIVAIFTIFDYLLDRKLWEYGKELAIITTTLFIPILMLIGIPTNFKDLPQEKDAKVLRIILEYIVIPVIFIYTAVLYIYIAKILINQNLPRGKIVYLVTALGFVGNISYFVADKGEKFDSKLIRFFKKYFFKILIAPLILMTVAISLRIKQYGITTPRYLICACLSGMWLSVLFSFKSNRCLTKFIYLVVVILLIFSAFTPWRATYA